MCEHFCLLYDLPYSLYQIIWDFADIDIIEFIKIFKLVNKTLNKLDIKPNILVLKDVLGNVDKYNTYYDHIINYNIVKLVYKSTHMYSKDYIYKLTLTKLPSLRYLTIQFKYYDKSKYLLSILENTSLLYLSVADTPIDNFELKYISNLPLKVINLRNTSITKLDKLPFSTVISLNIVGCNIKKDQLVYLRLFVKLEKLAIDEGLLNVDDREYLITNKVMVKEIKNNTNKIHLLRTITPIDRFSVHQLYWHGILLSDFSFPD